MSALNMNSIAWNVSDVPQKSLVIHFEVWQLLKVCDAAFYSETCEALLYDQF